MRKGEAIAAIVMGRKSRAETAREKKNLMIQVFKTLLNSKMFKKILM